MLDIGRLAPGDKVAEMPNQNEIELAVTISGFNYPAMLNHCFQGSEAFVSFQDTACRVPVRSIEEYGEARNGVVNFGANDESEVEKFLTDHCLKGEVSLSEPTASIFADLIQNTDMIVTMPRRLCNFI